MGSKELKVLLISSCILVVLICFMLLSVCFLMWKISENINEHHRLEIAVGFQPSQEHDGSCFSEMTVVLPEGYYCACLSIGDDSATAIFASATFELTILDLLTKETVFRTEGRCSKIMYTANGFSFQGIKGIVHSRPYQITMRIEESRLTSREITMAKLKIFSHKDTYKHDAGEVISTLIMALWLPPMPMTP